MLTIYKYNISLHDNSEFEMPQGAEILYVANQNENICMWARVSTTAPWEKRTFYIVGTGHPCSSDKYIGSVLLNYAKLVFHIFEKENNNLNNY